MEQLKITKEELKEFTEKFSEYVKSEEKRILEKKFEIELVSTERQFYNLFSMELQKMSWKANELHSYVKLYNFIREKFNNVSDRSLQKERKNLESRIKDKSKVLDLGVQSENKNSELKDKIQVDYSTLEIMYYFVNKIEGTGSFHATQILDTLFNPILFTIESARKEIMLYEQLTKDLATCEQYLEAFEMGAKLEENPYYKTFETIWYQYSDKFLNKQKEELEIAKEATK